MAEDPLQESFSASTRALFGTIGFLLLMLGGEMMLEKQEPRLALGAVLVGCGILCFYLVSAGRALRQRLPAGSVGRLNAIAGDPRWWLASLLVLVSAVVIWRLTEVVYRPVDAAQIQELDAQKSTLIEWLQQAKSERDQLRAHVQNLQAQQSATARPNPIMESTAHLPSADKEQLAKTLHDVAQLLERIMELTNDATREVFQIGNDVFGEVRKPISKEWIDTHRQRLLSFLESAKAYQKELDDAVSSGNGKYYGPQISFIVGQKPGERMPSLSDKIDGYIHYFDAWSKIKNVEEPEERGLLAYQQGLFSTAMGETRMWSEERVRRLQELRNALQRS